MNHETPEVHRPVATKSVRDLKTNLILAASLAVLSGFALWYEYSHRPKVEKKEEVSKRVLPQLEGAEIERVLLFKDGKEQLVSLLCQKGCKDPNFSSEWAVRSEQGEFSADGGATNGLFNQISKAEPTEQFDVSGPSDPAMSQYGITDGSNRYEIFVKGQKDPFTIKLGSSSPVSQDIYTFVTGPGYEGKKIYLLSSTVRDAFNKEPNHWRSKKIFSFAANDIASIEINNSGKKLLLQKSKETTENTWYVEPGHILADSETVDTFATGIAVMTVNTYMEQLSGGSRKKYGMNGAPTGQLVATLKDGSKHRIDLYEKKGKPSEFYAAIEGNPTIAKMDLSVAQKFKKSVDDFRLKKLFTSAERFKVAQIDYAPSGASPHILKLNNGKWSADSLATLDSEKVDKLITSLGSIRIAKFLSTKKPSGVKSEGVINLKDDLGKSIRKIELLQGKTQRFVHLNGAEYAEIDSSTAKDFSLTIDAVTTTAK
jgi:hypothetical protein